MSNPTVLPVIDLSGPSPPPPPLPAPTTSRTALPRSRTASRASSGGGSGSRGSSRTHSLGRSASSSIRTSAEDIEPPLTQFSSLETSRVPVASPRGRKRQRIDTAGNAHTSQDDSEGDDDESNNEEGQIEDELDLQPESKLIKNEAEPVDLSVSSPAGSDDEVEIVDMSSTGTPIKKQEPPAPSPATKNSLSGYTCPICFSPPTRATLTPCGHVCCGECLFTAVKSTLRRGAYSNDPDAQLARCPVCRAPLQGWDGKGGGVIGLIPRVQTTMTL